MQYDKKYEKFFKQAEEVLAHHKAGDETWAKKYEEIFLSPTSLTDEDFDKIDAIILPKDVRDYSMAEKCVALMISCGLRFREIAKLKRHDFIALDGDHYVDLGRVVPLPPELYVMVMETTDNRNDYILGDGKNPVDPNMLSDKVYALLDKTGVLHENVLVALAVKILTAKEETKGRKKCTDMVLEENDLIEYLFRVTYSTLLYSAGAGRKQIMYWLGLSKF